MGFDLHIPEESLRGDLIRRVAIDQNVTIDLALAQIFDEGLRATLKDAAVLNEGLVDPVGAIHHLIPVSEMDKSSVPSKPVEGSSEEAKPSYSSYFGIAKGRPGSFESREAIDLALAELRNEW